MDYQNVTQNDKVENCIKENICLQEIDENDVGADSGTVQTERFDKPLIYNLDEVPPVYLTIVCAIQVCSLKDNFINHIEHCGLNCNSRYSI